MSQDVVTQYATTEIHVSAQTFRASWVDTFIGWVRRLPMPVWSFYVGVYICLYLLFNLVIWIDGSRPTGYFDYLPGLWALYIVYYLALMHYLNGVANRALNTFRPALAVDDAEFNHLHRELTTMPARSALLAGVTGILVTLLFMWSPASLPAPSAQSSQLSMVTGILITLVGNFIIATSVYHAVRQLVIVSRIHNTVTRVSLFRRGPLYAFSVLTARTGVGYILAMAIGISPRTGSAVFSQATEYFVAVILLPLAVAAFILPLLGIHHLMVKEKKRLQAEVGLRLESLMVELHQCVDDHALKEIGALKTAIESLLAERDVVAKTPTWPWQVGTLAGFLSAFALPLVIWLTQQLLNRLLHP